MHSDAKSLVEHGDALFSKKRPLDSRNQDIADHFYPERATFTVTRDVGDEWAEHLVTGYPSMVRRDLGNSFGSMLRPKGQQWFHIGTDRGIEDEDHEAKAWLERASRVQRNAMYDRKAMFTRATKEGDHDFAAFGGAVISTEVNRRDNTLLYRCWHLRDVAWIEDSYGQLCEIHRNWNPSARELCYYFPKSVHPEVARLKEKEPEKPVKVRHVVIRSDMYDGEKRPQPWVSLFIDVQNKHILEERGSWTRIYTIPRWATVSDSQYPFSPATLIALPDARLIQAMVMTMLDAGERAANPPMIGVSEAIRGDLNIYPGGFTAIDAEYDERLGEVLRPLTVDKSGLPMGMEMTDRTQAAIREAFYLNTLTLPPAGNGEMTAFEVGQRVQEYIRQALPLFEPMEADYNGALCDITFETLMREGAFGSMDRVPESLSDAEISFSFESPLAEMIDRQKGQKFLEAKAMIAEAVAMDESAMAMVDFKAALRDVLQGIGAPAKWMRSEAEVSQIAEAQEQAQEAAALLGAMDQSAGVAEKLSNASQGFSGGVS